MNAELKTIVQPVPAESENLSPIGFTQLTASEHVTKKYSLNADGTLSKTAEPTISNYRANRIGVSSAYDFAQALDQFDPHTSLALGVTDPQYDGCWTSAKDTGKFSRTAKNKTSGYFEFPKQPGAMLLDVDDCDFTPAQFFSILHDIAPEIIPAAKVIRYSSSAGIYAGNDLKTKLNKYHVYIFLKDVSDCKRLGDILFNRLLLAGYGVSKVGKNGTVYVRTLIDKAVWSPERIIYEAAPHIGPGLRRVVPPTEVVEGGILDSYVIKDLTPVEVAQVSRIEAEIRASVAKEADAIKAEYQKKQFKVRRALPAYKDKTDSEIRREVKALGVGFVSESQLITLPRGGQYTLKELIRQQYTGYFHDFIEPEAGDSKAKLDRGPDGSVRGVLSFLHHGTRYKAVPDDVYKRVSRLTPATTNTRLTQDHSFSDDRNIVDIDALVEYQNAYYAVGDVLGSGVSVKFLGQSYGTTNNSIITKGRAVFVTLMDIEQGGYELIQVAKALRKSNRLTQANYYSGDDLAKCVFHQIKYDSQFFGNLIECPYTFLKTSYPELEAYHLDRLTRYANILLASRQKLLKQRLHITAKGMSYKQLKRRDDGLLNWTDDVFSNDFEIVALGMAHGSGKTAVGFKHVMNDVAQGKTNIYVSFLKTLIKDAATRLGVHHYEDDSDHIEFGVSHALAVCLPSMGTKALAEKSIPKIRYLCVDEIEQVLRGFSEKTSKIFSKIAFDSVYAALCTAVRRADKVFVADADISQQTLDWLCEIRGVKPDKVLFVDAEPVDTGFETKVTFHKTNACVKGVIAGIVEQLKAGEKVLVPVTLAKEARAVYEALTKAGFNGLMVADAAGKCDPAIDYFMENPSAESLRYDFITYTSKCGTGVSIEHETPHFTKVMAIFTNTVLNANSCLQGLRRGRYVRKFDINVYFGQPSGSGGYIEPLTHNNVHCSGFNLYQKNLRDVDQFLFVDALKHGLDKFGFNPVYDVGAFSAKQISFKEADVEAIMAAKDVDEYVAPVLTRYDWYANQRLEISTLFRTKEAEGNTITSELVEYFLTDRHKLIPERWAALADKGWDDPTDQRIIRSVFLSVCKTELKPKQITAFGDELRANYDLFRAYDLLPDTWGKRMKKTFTARDAKAVMTWWGFDVAVARYDVDVNKLVVSINPLLMLIKDVLLEDEKAAKASEYDEVTALILKLKDDGFSNGQIAKEVGMNRSSIGRRLKTVDEKRTNDELAQRYPPAHR